jgi:hypothetical protein
VIQQCMKQYGFEYIQARNHVLQQIKLRSKRFNG